MNKFLKLETKEGRTVLVAMDQITSIEETGEPGITAVNLVNQHTLVKMPIAELLKAISHITGIQYLQHEENNITY